ncbi:MAG: hypothetical protein JJE45_00450 [Prolixibacteraceae bacterium]|nr:hypothetical protein [Prolixibacteraceae bacterium]
MKEVILKATDGSDVLLTIEDTPSFYPKIIKIDVLEKESPRPLRKKFPRTAAESVLFIEDWNLFKLRGHDTYTDLCRFLQNYEE